MSVRKIGVILETQKSVEAFIDAANNFSGSGLELKERNIVKEGERSTKRDAVFSLSDCEVIVRCLRNIIPPEDLNINETSCYNSKQQYMLLPGYLKYDNLDLVFSIDAAGSTKSSQLNENESVNGNVFFGANFFSFDCRDVNKDPINSLNPIVSSVSSVNRNIFSLLDEEEKNNIIKLFKNTPKSPALKKEVNINFSNVAITLVNILNESSYTEGDVLSYSAAKNILGEDKNLVSFDTLHGIVNMSALKAAEMLNKKLPCIFVSGIMDRFTNYEEEVDADGKQEYAASYNSAISVLSLIKKINNFPENLSI